MASNEKIESCFCQYLIFLVYIMKDKFAKKRFWRDAIRRDHLRQLRAKMIGGQVFSFSDQKKKGKRKKDKLNAVYLEVIYKGSAHHSQLLTWSLKSHRETSKIKLFGKMDMK